MGRRKRRVFSEEQKASSVEYVRSTGKTICEAARDLELTESALRRWVEEAQSQVSEGPGEKLSQEEREELRRLRRENQQLRLEREFLKKAAAFFAKESSERSS
jgi:transposase